MVLDSRQYPCQQSRLDPICRLNLFDGLPPAAEDLLDPPPAAAPVPDFPPEAAAVANEPASGPAAVFSASAAPAAADGLLPASASAAELQAALENELAHAGPPPLTALERYRLENDRELLRKLAFQRQFLRDGGPDR